MNKKYLIAIAAAILIAGAALFIFGRNGRNSSQLKLSGTLEITSVELSFKVPGQLTRRLADARHDFYVLDEFTYPLKWGWIDTAAVVETLAARPGTQHVVITGRDAPAELIEVADLVTEMMKVKHPMDAGRKGQKGIEW